MGAEDMIKVPPPSHSGSGSESGELCDFGNSDLGRESREICDSGNPRPLYHEADSQPDDCEAERDKIEGEKIELDGNARCHVVETEQRHTSANDSSVQQLSIEMTETIRVRERSIVFSSEEKLDNSNSRMQADDLQTVQNGSPGNAVVDDTSMSGIKNVRMKNDDHKPSVHVIYNSLTSASKQKLDEVLQQWSKWQAENVCTSLDKNELIESGEESYFCALQVGTEKISAVSFWIDSQTSNERDKDGKTVPLYDRGYAFGLSSADGSRNLEGGMEIIEDASRCFNCGSYSHSMKQCPKPRDYSAVTKARKEHNWKKCQSASSYKPIRYFQNSQGGKFDDLKPGSLTGETRQLLGLGEFDPPPWLNRMREIGYPPGYLDNEDQPSGITVYADGEIDEGREDGEISEMKHDTIEREHPNKRMKMTVEFPGVNAPITDEADARRWAPSASSSSDSPRSKSPQLSNLYSEEHGSKGHHHEQRSYGNFRDDGPPGVDPGFSYSISYTPRYSSYIDQSHSLTRSASDG